MKDFKGRQLEIGDQVAFIKPFSRILTSGYIDRWNSGGVRIKFWIGDAWDYVVVKRNVIAKYFVDNTRSD